MAVPTAAREYNIKTSESELTSAREGGGGTAEGRRELKMYHCIIAYFCSDDLQLGIASRSDDRWESRSGD